MKIDHLLCLDTVRFHKMFYTEWGDPDNERIVVCVHGLTRNGRDFDFLAQALAPHFRVICPDVAGRGRSDWLTRKEDYGYAQYLADMTALLARVTAGRSKGPTGGEPLRSNLPTIYWVGTSMGGMIGMLLAARPGTPIRKLVVNDVGPFIPQAALTRIGGYVGQNPLFDSVAELEVYLRNICAPFGPLTDPQWQHVIHHSSKQHADGKWGLSYDPDIGTPFRKGPVPDVDLSTSWNAITCPTLALRGADSDLLLRETAELMKNTGPRARVVEFKGIGHAPMLMAEDQITLIKDFLLSAA